MINDPSKIDTLARNLLKEMKNCTTDIEQLDILKTILGISLSTDPPSAPPRPLLTHQENQCLLAAAHGKTSFETGKLLGIKSSTVETHRKSIKQKLGCTTIAHAVFVALCCHDKTLNQLKDLNYERKTMPTDSENINLSTTRQPFKLLVVGHTAEQLNELEWLNNAEFMVETVSNGLMALEKFDQGFDLLLIKNNMPSGLSGLQITKILQEMRPQQMVPVVLV
ncbi:MAG TPA: LuxR C-terminal-related transcriptional regulator [Gammaproteobacteria bacterium]|nr:LuxR C-terminal-related transcriptional regulator [Gammaproteobacteria bacterium]